jgi:hypothetical protein
VDLKSMSDLTVDTNASDNLIHFVHRMAQASDMQHTTKMRVSRMHGCSSYVHIGSLIE